MTEPAIPALQGSITPVPRSDHETVSFAVFLEYRARRMRAPVVESTGPTPDRPTTPADPPAPEGRAVAMVVPIRRDR
jgi:hypothetical protein